MQRQCVEILNECNFRLIFTMYDGDINAFQIEKIKSNILSSHKAIMKLHHNNKLSITNTMNHYFTFTEHNDKYKYNTNINKRNNHKQCIRYYIAVTNNNMHKSKTNVFNNIHKLHTITYIIKSYYCLIKMNMF